MESKTRTSYFAVQVFLIVASCIGFGALILNFVG